MFFNHTAHTGSCSQARYQLPTGYESNVELVLLGNADNSLSIGGDEENEELHDAQLVQVYLEQVNAKPSNSASSSRNNSIGCKKERSEFSSKFTESDSQHLWSSDESRIRSPTFPVGTIRNCGSRVSKDRAKSGRHCCLSGHESHSCADDFWIQKHWEKRRGELQSTASRLCVRTHFQIRSGTGSTSTLFCARSNGKDDTGDATLMRWILFQFRNEVQHYHLRAEGQAEESQQYPVELKQNLDLSHSDNTRLESFFGELRNTSGHVEWRPEIVRQQNQNRQWRHNSFVAEGQDQRSQGEVSTKSNEVAHFTSHDLFRNRSESIESRKIVGYRNNYTRRKLSAVEQRAKTLVY